MNIKNLLVDKLNTEQLDLLNKDLQSSNLSSLLKEKYSFEELKKLYQQYNVDLELEPVEVEAILKCSTFERKKWSKENKLFILDYKELTNKLGKKRLSPIYSSLSVLSLTDNMLKSWRQKPVKKQEIHKKANLKIRIDAQIQDKIFDLAYWLFFNDYWLNQLKKKQHLITGQDYKQQYNQLLELKKKGIYLLSKSNLVTIYKYIPLKPHQVYIEYCDKHWNEIIDSSQNDENDNDIFNNQFLSKEDYYFLNPDKYDNCKDCFISKTDNAYVKYFIELSKKDITYKFIYSIEYNLLKDLKEKKIITDSIDEGLFNNNLKVNLESVIIHTLSFTQKMLTQIVNDYSLMLGT